MRSAATEQNASTTSGSNCVSAHRRSSSSATSALIRARYGRLETIASYASQTAITRAPSGMSSPARLSG